MRLREPSYYGFTKYKEYRPQQKRAIEAILKAIDKEKRFIIAELPTGSGKSLIAMTLHKIISEKTYIVVSTKTLQNQYMREFNIPTVMGRNNFNCLIKPKLTVDKAPCNVRKCGKISECPYYVQRNVAIESPVSIHNYTYYLTAMNYTNLWKKADLVVFDEAHTMDSHLSSFVSLRIPKDILHLGSNVIESLEIAYEDVSIKLDTMREIVQEIDEESKRYKVYMDLINSYVSYERKIRTVIDNYDNAKWIIEETNKSYVFRPVWVSRFTDMYFSHGNIFLMMSATIGDIHVFTRLLGLKEDEVVFIKGGAIFSVKNRPVKVISGESINYKNLGEVLPKIVKKIDVIIKNEKGKGIIHVPSYSFGEYIYYNSKYKDIMYIHNNENRDIVIDKFMSASKGILVSPSSHTGLDFKDDLARWQVIAKVPYADLSDEVIKARFNENRMWYTQDAILRIVQGYGRIVRSYTDWGTTYILDGNIMYLIKRYNYMFPSWFLDAFKFCTISVENIKCRGE